MAKNAITAAMNRAQKNFKKQAGAIGKKAKAALKEARGGGAKGGGGKAPGGGR